MNVRVKQVVSYGGHSVSTNGSVNLTLKARYSELQKSVMLLQMLNNDVSIRARMPGESPCKLGMFRVKSIHIDDDGESVLKFNGLNDFIEMNSLNGLVTDEEFAVMYEADVEVENENENEEEMGGQ